MPTGRPAPRASPLCVTDPHAPPVAQTGPGDRRLIKICGVRTPEVAAAAAAAGADLIGFVFVAGSARQAAPDLAAECIAAMGPGARSVGLFANAAPTNIASMMAQARCNIIQLHGAETDAMVAACVDLRIGPVIRAVSADQRDHVQPAGAAMLLIDAPAGASRLQGGHGAAYDHAGLLHAYRPGLPFLVAGGLHPGNVGGAMRALLANPDFAGVDVSSGVERRRGEKDIALIEDFIAAARAGMASDQAGCTPAPARALDVKDPA